MDSNRLIDLRKKKVENRLKQHQELLNSNTSIKEAISSLNQTINAQKPVNFDSLSKQLDELKELKTYSDDIKNLEIALKSLSTADKLDDVIKAVGGINNKDVVAAVNNLIDKIEIRTIDQSPEQYQPVRRVRKIGQRLVFDDDPLQVTVNGGAMGGGGVPTFRNNKGQVTQVTLTSEGKVPVEITDELGGIATSAKQLPDNHRVTVSNIADTPIISGFATATKQDLLLAELEKKADLTETQPVSVETLPLPIGASTSSKQDDQIAQFTAILTELTQKTEATQNQQVELINAIRLLIQVIANPAYVDKSANQMRAQITGSLTTVTTVTNLTNFGSFPADHLQRMDNMTAWATNIRSLIA